jgi:hypothetical protein
MTDEELCKRLRNFDDGATPTHEAADRIGQLGKACAEWADVSQKNYQRAKAAEAKLAKAVEGLREIAGECGCSTARATLAEIESSEAVTLGEKT